MRSDVKIGLGVGAALVVAVVVYVAVGSSEKKGEPIDTTTSSRSTEGTAVASNVGTTSQSTPAPTTAPSQLTAAPTTAPSNTPLVVGIGGPTTQPSASNLTSTAIAPTTQPTNGALASAKQGDYDWQNLLAGKQTPPSLSASVGNSTTDSKSSADANPFKTPAGKYTIKAGDTLSSIAAAQYGNSSRWTDIVKANPGLKPSSLHVGQSINLPEGSNLKALAGSHSVDRTSTGSASLADSGKTYTVASGDNLIKISTKIFGDGKHANEIYQLNRSKIGSSPSRLRVGMKLKLPANAPTTQPV